MRYSVRYPLCDTDLLTEGRAESAKHIKVTNCVRGFVISLRTLPTESWHGERYIFLHNAREWRQHCLVQADKPPLMSETSLAYTILQAYSAHTSSVE